jgi:UDP-N-acetylglucosamine/UDP-N-acetylgalactosamine diphosphorylase
MTSPADGALLQTLEAADQMHLVHHVATLSDAEQAILLAQLAEQDWSRLNDLIASHVCQAPPVHIPESVAPAPFFPAQDSGATIEAYDQARLLGEQLIAQGKVAAFTVAGGQGTRLGWDGPKGTYPGTPLTQKPLFQWFAESLIKTGRKHGHAVPWYIMTSPLNDTATRAFFVEHDHFGIDPADVMFLEQGTLPSFSTEGAALLAGPTTLATNPDGHGGSLRALHTSGALDDMARRGVEQISYFQIDNPLVRCIDPLFLGLHARDGAQMSSKMVRKSNALEKVGNFVLADGRISVIEYSDLPDALAHATDEQGDLRFNGGSIAIHAIDRRFVEELNTGGFALPPHRAVKKVAHFDPATGETRQPAEPNAVKLEMFVFDALPLAQTSIVLETKREDEFGPIKNSEGVDSAESSKLFQTARAARWLEAAGVTIPRREDGTVDAVIEISPLTAIEPGDLKGLDLPTSIEAGSSVIL